MLLVKRYRASGFKMPRILLTNICCPDRQLFAEIVEELRQDGIHIIVEDHVPDSPTHPVYHLPEDVKPMYVKASSDSTKLRALAADLRHHWRRSGVGCYDGSGRTETTRDVATRRGQGCHWCVTLFMASQECPSDFRNR